MESSMPSSMGSGDSGGSSMMMSMPMTFTTDHSTPLFSAAWTPHSSAGYAGTCLFLVALAVISRLLGAGRTLLEQRWHDRAVRRRYVVVADGNGNGVARGAEEEKLPAVSLLSSTSSAAASSGEADATLTTRGVDERVRIVRAPRWAVQGAPWRFSTDLPRACVFTVQAGVGYLLMLAVMTLNVGYFLSVLSGLFVGELAVGRYTVMDDGHH